MSSGPRRSSRFHFGTIVTFDLYGDLSSKAILFAHDTSPFSVTHDITTSANELNNDLQKICDWAFQWKMSFNPNPNKKSFLVEN